MVGEDCEVISGIGVGLQCIGKIAHNRAFRLDVEDRITDRQWRDVRRAPISLRFETDGSRSNDFSIISHHQPLTARGEDNKIRERNHMPDLVNLPCGDREGDCIIIPQGFRYIEILVVARL